MREGKAAAPGALLWGGLAILLSTGCNLAKDVVDIPGQAVRVVAPDDPKPTAVDFVEMQQKLLRFVDAYQMSLNLAIEQIRKDGKALEPKLALQLKLALVSSTTSIVSGANARANLLDLTVFATVTRLSVEDHWQAKVFGGSGMPLLEACRDAEEDIWLMAKSVLTAEQQQELRLGILTWHQAHPQPEQMLAARAGGFASEVAAGDKAGGKRSGGVLNLLTLDPLAGLDPAVREIAQARLLAERALFVTQKLPMLILYQTELLTTNALELPAVRQLVANTTQVSASIDRVAGVAEKLPDRLVKEREELVKALEAQEKTLRPIVSDVKQTVEAGGRLTESLTVTLKALDEVLKRLGLPAPPAPPTAAPSEPFRIQEYTQAAAQAEATAKQLTELIATLDRTLASEPARRISEQVDPAVRRAEAGVKDILDRAFRDAILLVVAVLCAALIYRVVAARLAPAKPAKTP